MFLHVSVCPQGEGVNPSMPCRFPGPHPRRSLRGMALGVSRPTPRGKLRGLTWGVSRPTPRGAVEVSDLGGLQAHTWGGFSRNTPGGGVSRPTPRGFSRPTPGGSLGSHPGGGSPGPHLGGYPTMHWGRPPTPLADSYCWVWYASYWNAFLWILWFKINLIGSNIYVIMVTKIVTSFLPGPPVLPYGPIHNAIQTHLTLLLHGNQLYLTLGSHSIFSNPNHSAPPHPHRKHGNA